MKRGDPMSSKITQGKGSMTGDKDFLSARCCGRHILVHLKKWGEHHDIQNGPKIL